MRRGEIWVADLPPPDGIRPALLLMRNEAYTQRRYVILTTITTRIRNLATEVPLGIEEGLRTPSAANLDVILTVPNSRLQRRIGVISPEKMRAVEAALRFALGMEH